MEVGDICKISEASEKHILNYLEKRYMQGEIYSNASEILIALNPYQDIPQLYGLSIMEAIDKISTPHIYKTAREALRGLKANGSQSIIIGGLTGSGKTETAKRIIEFLCGRNAPSSIIAKRISAAQTIMESFGNARAMGNLNSSRFCKFVQLNYDENSNLVGAKIQQHLLETNRICDPNENNFHIFYALSSGGPDNLLKYLSNCSSLSNLNQTKFTPLYDFKTIDTTLAESGFDGEERSTLYKILVGILLLQNITFERENSDSDDECQVSKSSKYNLNSLTELFQLDICKLENALVSRSVRDRDSLIKISLNIRAAEKSRDTLSKILYDHLFKHIVHRMNTSTSTSKPAAYIGILDIAGHESNIHGPNTFDQLCINYVNEKFQQFFIQRVLIREKQWYDKERLDAPFVPFLDNCDIIEMFDDKCNGLLSLLDQQCILKEPSVINFAENFLCAWSGSKKNAVDRTKMADEFMIRHFSGSVIYSTADFIEKNLIKSSGEVCLIAHEVLKPLTDFDSKRVNSSKSFSLNMKIELNGLIKCLESTNSHFIRCIKPNDTRSPKDFDKVLMLQQLKSANIIAYAEFMQIGYPTRISFDSLNKTYERFTSCRVLECDFTTMKQFYTKLLLSIGFQLKDFKFGEKLVFFRAQNSALIKDLMESPANSIMKMNDYIAKMAASRSKFRSTVLSIIFLKRWLHLSKQRDSPRVFSSKAASSSTTAKLIAPATQSFGKSSVNRPAKGAEFAVSEMDTRPKHQQKNIGKPEMPAHRSDNEKRPKKSVRCDGRGHLPIFDKNSYATRCKNEECKFKTNVECMKCKVHMCFTRARNCFTEFHLLEQSESD